MDAVSQRSGGSRRSRTQDNRPAKIAKDASNDDGKAQHSKANYEALPEYRSSAEQDQQFECKLSSKSGLSWIDKRHKQTAFMMPVSDTGFAELI